MSKTLVWVEHDNTSVKDATLAVVTAASQLGEVTALVVGSGVDGVAAAAAQIAGVTKVLKADDAAYAHALAENVAPLVASVMAGYDAFLAPATTTGSRVVTYIQTKARKRVLPMAILFGSLKKGWGSLGAEYRKVTKAPKSMANQYWDRVIKEIPAPTIETMVSSRCHPL